MKNERKNETIIFDEENAINAAKKTTVLPRQFLSIHRINDFELKCSKVCVNAVKYFAKNYDLKNFLDINIRRIENPLNLCSHELNRICFVLHIAYLLSFASNEPRTKAIANIMFSFSFIFMTDNWKSRSCSNFRKVKINLSEVS